MPPSSNDNSGSPGSCYTGTVSHLAGHRTTLPEIRQEAVGLGDPQLDKHFAEKGRVAGIPFTVPRPAPPAVQKYSATALSLQHRGQGAGADRLPEFLIHLGHVPDFRYPRARSKNAYLQAARGVAAPRFFVLMIGV
ncbi:hypothetical protein DIPPA_19157 [Diplonema papillatum]|nr:hypothetical protein DIPPA_19157 [Diplonema papillatum]